MNKKLIIISFVALGTLLSSCKKEHCPFLDEQLVLSDPKESYPYAPKELYRFRECGMDSVDCELMLPLAAVMTADREKQGRVLRYGDVKNAFDQMKSRNEKEYESSRENMEERRKK